MESNPADKGFPNPHPRTEGSRTRSGYPAETHPPFNPGISDAALKPRYAEDLPNAEEDAERSRHAYREERGKDRGALPVEVIGYYGKFISISFACHTKCS